MASIKLNENQQVLMPLMKKFNFKLNAYQQKKELSLNDVKKIEMYQEKLRPYIGLKPIYNLYKPLQKLLDTKFYNKFNKPIDFYVNNFFYNRNNNKVIIDYENNENTVGVGFKVSKRKYTFGDLINLGHYRLTGLHYVNEKYELAEASGEYNLGLSKEFSQYVNNIEYKFQLLWDEINSGYLEVDFINVNPNDKWLKREFKGVFPLSYEINIVSDGYLQLEIKYKKNILPYIRLVYKDKKLQLKNKNFTTKKISMLFDRMDKIKKQKKNFKFVRLRTNAFPDEYSTKMVPHVQQFIKKYPEFTAVNSEQFTINNKGLTRFYIGVLPNERHLLNNIKNFIENNSCNKYKYYTKNAVYTLHTPNYLKSGTRK